MILGLLCHGIVIVSLLVIFSRWLDDELVGDLCIYGLVVEFVIALFNVSFIFYTDSIFFLVGGELIDFGGFLRVTPTLCFDELAGFFFCILNVALLLCLYFLVEYFEYDSNSSNIIVLSSLFSHLAMWYFCSHDLFLLIFFWEAISIVSFLLVQHWSYRLPTYKAGLKVFVISQLGDLPLFVFIFLIFSRFGTSDMGIIISQAWLSSFDYISAYSTTLYFNFNFAVGLAMSFALMLKAAQFIFYPWLLDAMEAPVPISAQLHSSTLVIIGFYVVLRFQCFLATAPSLSVLFLIFGTITVVGASVLGYFQDDGKKLLACSTASQLGYAVTGIGLSLFEEAAALLIFCCCNKAFTFIWFGALMDRFGGISDFRLIGGAGNLTPTEHSGLVVAISNFTIAPGAFSWHVKSLLLQGQYAHETLLAKYAADVLSFTWFFSSLYLVTLYITLFLSPRRAATAIHLGTAPKFLRVWGLFSTTALNIPNFICAAGVVLRPTAGALSAFFFLLLLVTFIVLANPYASLCFGNVDLSWVTDMFAYNSFLLVNFYNA